VLAAAADPIDTAVARHGFRQMVKHSQAEFNSLATTLAAEFPSLPLEALARYIGDIVEWNDRIGLVSKRSTLLSIGRLVRQSGQLYEFLQQQNVMSGSGGESVVDIGTGAGFPGLVWKLMQPALAVTLVERRQKKVTFLQRTAVVLGLEGVEVVEGDAVEVTSYEWFSQHFDVATSFAVAAPDAIARLVEPFVKPRGHYCTMRPREEMTLPDRIGRALALVATAEHADGRFCLYRWTEHENPDSTP
jgi:16S rRNA (guanine(527)-N(7))-methyltransferase RsmG